MSDQCVEKCITKRWRIFFQAFLVFKACFWHHQLVLILVCSRHQRKFWGGCLLKNMSKIAAQQSYEELLSPLIAAISCRALWLFRGNASRFVQRLRLKVSSHWFDLATSWSNKLLEPLAARVFVKILIDNLRSHCFTQKKQNLMFRRWLVARFWTKHFNSCLVFH